MTDPRLKPRDQIVAERDARKALKESMRKPLKKVNKERVAKKAESEGYEPEYLAYLRTMPCIITGARTGERIEVRELGITRWRIARVEPAHMKAGRTEGTDLTALPLDYRFHREQHRIGLRAFAEKYGLDIPALIAKHRKAYSLENAAKAANTKRERTNG